ncbi:MAG TPA: hypothetical protein VKT19_07470, partial [Steroidobacteraceae bacterium]|nr:hypothetical protein [Steroidobacteraceae bacterium]
MAVQGADRDGAQRPSAAQQADVPRSFGAQIVRAAGDRRAVRFRLWAPGQARVALKLGDAPPVSLSALEAGWHELTSPEAHAGTLYQFVLSDG